MEKPTIISNFTTILSKAMKTKFILLSFIIGFPIIGFAQFSAIASYSKVDTAVCVKFINNYANKEVVVKNESHMYDGGSYCDVYFIGTKGDTLTWFRCHYVTKLKPSMLLVVLKPKQEENFIFQLKQFKYDVNLECVKKIKIHVWISRIIQDTKEDLKPINYRKEFSLK